MNSKAIVFSIIGIFLLDGGATGSPDPDEQAFDISISGTSITYTGAISQAANQFLFSLVEQADTKPTTLIITSKGGDADAGLDLGRWVFESQLDVHVSSFCGSLKRLPWSHGMAAPPKQAWLRPLSVRIQVGSKKSSTVTRRHFKQ